MSRGLLTMRWVDALFAHWRVDPATVAARLPDGLDVATHDGDAWLGVVPFEMTDIRPRGSPLGLSFPELNLRTYVTDGETRGVYFLSLDAADPLGVGVARLLFRLPYHRASMDVSRVGDRVTFTSTRVGCGGRARRGPHAGRGPHAARFDATYGPAGEPSEPEPGSLEAFLVENYRFYTEGRGGLYRGDVSHDPWPIAPADCEIRVNGLFAANGLDEPDGEPLCHYSPGQSVTADRIRRLRPVGRDRAPGDRGDDGASVAIPVEGPSD